MRFSVWGIQRIPGGGGDSEQNTQQDSTAPAQRIRRYDDGYKTPLHSGRIVISVRGYSLSYLTRDPSCEAMIL